MKKQNKEITVRVEFTEGWEERFAKASYNLYKRIEARKIKNEKISA